jgi:mannose-6-phosphate isomerase-like protein (cupin superfamily)
MTGGGAVVRTILDTGAGRDGRDGLVRRLVELGAGSRFEGTAGPGGELWFVIAGTGRLEPRTGPAIPVRRDTGVWLPPGALYRLSADGPGEFTLDSVSLPAGAAGSDGDATQPRLSELRDCAEEVTGDRRFRVLHGPSNGCSAATQFVGEIPPGRAPDHYHHYDEVIYVLEGQGVLHLGDRHDPVGPGAAIHLRPRQVHSLENSGPGPMRVLGVFRPAGSPSEAYYPGGTRATSES